MQPATHHTHTIALLSHGQTLLSFFIDQPSIFSSVFCLSVIMSLSLRLDVDVGESVASDSMYFETIWSVDVADRLLAALRNEVLYVPRSSMTFAIFGKTFQLPRDKAFQGDVAADGSYPLYRYGGKSYPTVQRWTSTVRAIRDALTVAMGQYCNHVVINRYRDGADHIGLHRDKDGDFVEGTSVLTVSLGGSRRFVLKHADGATESMSLEHGSLFVLGSETNKAGEWKHSIAKTAGAVEERISLTFRSIKTRYDVVRGEVIEG